MAKGWGDPVGFSRRSFYTQN